MLAPDVRFEGWTATDWVRFLSLFRRPESPGRAGAEGPKGGVIAVHEGGRLRKLLHTVAGRLELAGEAWPVPLAELAGRHRAAWALSLRSGALEALMDGLALRTHRGDDGMAQALTGARVLGELQAEGAIERWPRPLPVPPASTHALVTRTLDSLCPVGRVLLAGLFEGGELWTSVALRRREGGIDLILGPDELRPAMGLLSGDWRRDYRHLVDAVERRAGPLATGVFTETATLRSLTSRDAPGALARAVAVRDVIVSPFSVAAAVPLAVDVVRAAWAAFGAVADRVDPSGRLGGWRASRARERDDEGLVGFLKRVVARP